MKNKLRRLPLAMGLAGVLTGYSLGAGAAGFALIEQSGSGLGNAFAGGAASAEDASTIFYNPAGLTRLPGRQFVVALHAIDPSAKFSNAGSTSAPLQTPGGNGGDAGDLGWVPNLYYAMDINPKLKFGLGINAPFGLKTEYDPTWIGRFQAIRSEVKTYNVNPSLAYKVNDTVSVGAGINYQHISAELTNAVNYSAAIFAAGASPLVCGAPACPGIEGQARVTGSDNAWGFNLGALFQVNPDTRVGVAYRSSISYRLSGGNVTFSNRPVLLAAALPDGAVTADVRMPDSFSLSVFHQLNPKWDLMADLSWTGWSSFKNLTVVRSNGTVLSTTPENWRDTYRLSFGANYRYSDALTWRGGIAYDQTPVRDAFRTARIPDNDRTWLAVGGQYKVSKAGAVDVSYAHLFVKNSSINNNQAAAGAGILVGNYDNEVNILSVQYTHNF